MISNQEELEEIGCYDTIRNGTGTRDLRQTGIDEVPVSALAFPYQSFYNDIGPYVERQGRDAVWALELKMMNEKRELQWRL